MENPLRNCLISQVNALYTVKHQKKKEGMIMLERIMEQGTFVYILWGIGFLGLLLQMITAFLLGRAVKASENMITTRKRIFKEIRKKNEALKSLGVVTKDTEAFADKYLLKMRIMGAPLYSASNAMKTLRAVVCMVAAGGLLIYMKSEIPFQMSEELVLNGVIVAAFLAAVENIIPVKNKIGIMKANVMDYLNNTVACMKQKEEEPVLPFENEIPENQTEIFAREASTAVEGNKKKESDDVSDDEVLADFLKGFLCE